MRHKKKPGHQIPDMDWRIAKKKGPSIISIIHHLNTNAREPASQVLTNLIHDDR